MIIKTITPKDNYVLHIVGDKQQAGLFDVSPYMHSEVFSQLSAGDNFLKVRNGRYFVEWECGADLSADTIEANWKKL